MTTKKTAPLPKKKAAANADLPLAPDWRSPVNALRAAILASDPGITEQIKWNAPSFCFAGDDRVTFRFPPRGGAQLIFHRGVARKDTTGFRFDDETGLLDWAAPDRGVLTFASPEDVTSKTSTVVSLVRAWMKATTA